MSYGTLVYSLLIMKPYHSDRLDIKQKFTCFHTFNTLATAAVEIVPEGQ